MKVYLNTPLTCSHDRHVEGPRCPDCGTLERPRPLVVVAWTAPPALSTDDYVYMDGVEQEALARREAIGRDD